MLEIEAKVRIKNLDAMAKTLRHLGASFLYTVREQDMYYDSPDWKLLKSNLGLRLRKRTLEKSNLKTHIYLTFKGPTGKSAFKSRHEIQVEIDDFEIMKKLLNQLGYRSGLTVRKVRQIWKLGKCEICLDKVQGLGTFIEVEGPSEKAINIVLDKLNLDKSEHIACGYARMLAKKKK